MNIGVQLGFDIGGTTSRWVACASSGAVVARGEAGGASGRVFDPSEHERLSAVARRVAEETRGQGLSVRRIVAGLTGFGVAAAGKVRSVLSGAFGIADTDVVLFDDMTLAYLEQFSPGEGHLVSAGTGSFGLYVAADGSRLRVGGRGMLIDDAGSGAWIALRALDRIYRVFDRGGSFTGADVLAEEVLGAIGGRDWDDVRQFVYGGERGRIGTLSVAVARAASRGDVVAIDILHAAGHELGQLALALIARAGPRPIALIGRVFKLHVVLRQAVEHALAGHAVRLSKSDAALAAARFDPANWSAEQA